MADKILCPNCKHQFDISDVLKEELEKKLRGQAKEWQEKKETEFRQKEQLLQQKFNDWEKQSEKKHVEEMQKLQENLHQTIQKNVAQDFENKLKILQQTVEDNEEKLKQSREKELIFLQKERALKEKEVELEIDIEKRILAEREILKNQIQKEELVKAEIKEESHRLKIKELEKQLDDQKKLADEMKRKAEQGSMQLQGEVQEILLEELLTVNFPFDTIVEVEKGIKGADCVQIVKTQFGFEAGKIIFESKRTKDFNIEWIEKLKKDMRQLGADIAVIVTQTFPKDMDRFGEKDGVYICSISEVKSMITLLRAALIKIYDAKKSQENKGDKMVLLYDYLTGNEFNQQWKAIREGFMAIKSSIAKERDAMEKLWKVREKQLEKVLLNAAHIHGSVEGIAGIEAMNLTLDFEDKNLLDE
ncbi:MAG TPA: DUF2130 domain-containing protein [Leptospiraceae bacterium]|nr:DUF2130 domain-containing protein [Chitinophagaceae bacterium]HNM34973.1 DUF2130 domain-containing protein [Chitinophagaceae bacterium]HNN82505.1 DUF2130 domain-containing protein [Leptospiraceae bacterium]